MADAGETNGRRTIIGVGSKMEIGVLVSILAVAAIGLGFMVRTSNALERQQVSMLYFEKTQTDMTGELRAIRALLQQQGDALLDHQHRIGALEKKGGN